MTSQVPVCIMCEGFAPKLLRLHKSSILLYLHKLAMYGTKSMPMIVSAKNELFC